MSDIFILFIIILLKIFLFPTSQSTDFEVHRNLKSITNSLPINQWYFFSENKFTLNYPPLFAYMEYFLGKISHFFDNDITNLKKPNYASNTCKIFMRSAALIGDFFLFFSLKKLHKNLNLNLNQYFILLFSVQLNAGLVIADNINFQYNGILFGLLFFSLSFISEKKYILGAIFYFICVGMKQSFLYFAPAYFLFYFQYIIINNIKKKKYKKLIIKSALILLGLIFVFFITFLPFIIISFRENNLSQFIQIKKRLFPFKSGILHSHSAPNFWTLYSIVDELLYFLYYNSEIKINFIDKICNFLLKYKKYNKNSSSIEDDDMDDLNETEFDFLPEIDIKTTNIIIISFFLIYFLIFWYKKSSKKKEKNKIKNHKIKELMQHCIFSNLIIFNFGCQINEKDFLNISLLLLIYYISFVFIVEKKHKKILSFSDNITSLALIINFIGVMAQLPSVNDPKDYLVKIGLTLFYFIYCNIILFNKGDFNSDTETKGLFIFILCIELILDFFITFQNYIDFNTEVPGIKILENLIDRYPSSFSLAYSCINSVLVQTLILLLVI